MGQSTVHSVLPGGHLYHLLNVKSNNLLTNGPVTQYDLLTFPVLYWLNVHTLHLTPEYFEKISKKNSNFWPKGHKVSKIYLRCNFLKL